MISPSGHVPARLDPRLVFQTRGRLEPEEPALQIAIDEYLRLRGPLDWPHPFFEFQRFGIRTLASRDRLLLADDMGLGKTVQAVAALRILFHRREIEDTLAVVPAGLISQWQGALREWAPELRVSTIRGSATDRAWQWRAHVHVFLTSYETLRSDLTDNPHSAPRRRNWGVALFDEAQKIKNRETELARACKRVPRQRSWALTGTPLENRLDDLASICELVTPWRDGEPAVRFSPGPALLEHHSGIQLRRRKADVLRDLPAKSLIDVTLQLTSAQRETYLQAEREGVFRLHQLGATIRITHVLELITRLKQICNFCPQTGESAKISDLTERLATLVAEGHRALVFSQYADERFGAARVASEIRDFSPLAYTGALSTQERDDLVTRFRREPRHSALVLSLRAGGQGLNLQEASYVFHFDRWWNPAWERQAEDRTHRLGQRLPVTVYRYLCEDTIEERIDEILRSKQALFDTVVDDVSLDLPRLLTQAEIFGLFGLRVPR
ncbi:MAG: ATP-dependent helicase [Gemmatimonas sp.]|nr:ATP-dependent helicase [Gemmatimonas sp.]